MLDIIKQLNETLAQYVAEGDTSALAVSGGIDSMCMLSLCLQSGFLEKNNLIVVSVNHQIRGAEAERDIQFVQDFCVKNGVRFMPFAVDVPSMAATKRIGIEQAARDARRTIFADLVQKGVADKVLTAHHASDNVESILMHMFRGSGLNGMRGMQVLSCGYLLRPMLSIHKTQIQAYVAAHNVPYAVDGSNKDNQYTRNFIRNEVLPLIKKSYAGVENAVLGLSAEVQKTLSAVTLNEGSVRVSKEGKACIDVAVLDKNLGASYVLKAIQELGIANNFSRRVIDSIVGLKDKQNGARLNLPHGYLAEKCGQEVVLFKADNLIDKSVTSTDSIKALSLCVPFKTGTIVLGNMRITLQPTDDNAQKIKNANQKQAHNKPLYFDMHAIPNTAVFRFRQNGDRFKPFGGGTKKLKEYLIDKKIPAQNRDNLILLANGKDVLLIVGLEISDTVQCKEGSACYTLWQHP